MNNQTYRRIINICFNKAKYRCTIKNNKKGKALMGAFIVNKKLSCFLRE